MQPKPYPAPNAADATPTPADAQQLAQVIATLTNGREQPIPANQAPWAWHPTKHKGFL